MGRAACGPSLDYYAFGSLSMASPFDGLQMPRNLVCEFFSVFSRFEFTLKKAGFVSANRGRRAAPDWSRYCKQIGANLSTDGNEGLAKAIRDLIADPPQVQIAKGNTAIWNSVPLRGNSDVERALDATQRVRNNLFHGGKHTPHSPAGRDETLVRAALVVLHACLSVDDDFRAIYEQTDF